MIAFPSATKVFSVRRCLRDFPASDFGQPESFSAKSSRLLGRSEVANFGSTVSALRCFFTVLRDSPVRRLVSRIGSFGRNDMRRITFKSSIVITPLPPRGALPWGKGHTGQFSMEITRPTGSLLGANQHCWSYKSLQKGFRLAGLSASGADPPMTTRRDQTP